MKKKVLAVLLSMAMVATMLAGCGGSSDSGNGENASQSETDGKSGNTGNITIEIVAKGYQHPYWQAVLQGAENKAEELGVTFNFNGPNSESDITDQVQMLQNAVNAQPDVIGLAALDTDACLDAISQAQAAGIPIVGFDSGVPNAPEGAIVANASTDNYAAGEKAAEESWNAALKERIENATEPVRIGVMGADATSDSLIQRGIGFIDKMASFCEEAGKTVTVEGNERYVSDCQVEQTEGADVTIEIAVPSQTTSELSALDCQNLLSKPDIIAIYGSNQHSAEAMVTGDRNLNRFGTDEDDVIGIAFDSGKIVKNAVREGTFIGAITQAPVQMGEALVDLCVKAANGEKVENVDSGCQWYTAENIDNEEIAQNLYD